jgi:hypothetical protein
MVEILVRAVEGTCPDPCANPRRGDPVCVKPGGHTWGLCEGPPEYVIIKISDINDPATLEHQARPGLAPELRPLNPRRIRHKVATIIAGLLAPFGVEETPVQMVRPIVRRRRYCFSESIVSAAEQASGTLTISAATLAEGLIDQVGD